MYDNLILFYVHFNIYKYFPSNFIISVEYVNNEPSAI